MIERAEGTAVPNQRQGQNQQQNQQQQQNQDPAGQQQHLHINWSNFKPKFGKTRRRCRGTFTMLQ